MIHNVWYHWEQHREDGTLEIQLFLHSGYADVTIDCINRVNVNVNAILSMVKSAGESGRTSASAMRVYHHWLHWVSRNESMEPDAIKAWFQNRTVKRLGCWNFEAFVEKRDWAYFNDNENMRKSASFTGLKVSCPVDACLNRNCVKCHFWCVAHKTRKIAVRIEISVFTLFSSFVFSTSVPRAWKFQHMRTLKYEFSIQVLTVNSFDAIFSES